jgi:hypothetical protein
MPNFPRQLRLTGGDYFFEAMDRRLRRAGLPGNVCHLALRLEPGLNTERLRERLEASPIFDWLSRVRMVRLLPVLPPRWRTSARRGPILHEHDGEGANGKELAGLPSAVLGRELRAGRSPALALDLVRHADGSAHLVLSWHHSLMDVRGAELLLRHLQAGGAADSSPGVQDLFHPEQRKFGLPRLWGGYRRKVMFARGALALINTTCQEPLFSLLPAPQRVGRCQHHYRIWSFGEEETARIERHCQRLNASFRRSHFYLAASIQALHAVAARRGEARGAYLIPVPHDMRRRGDRGPIFSNQLSFLFYRIEPRLAASMSEMIGELTRQMMDQVRNRTPESLMAAMDLFKPMPLDFYLHRLGRPTRGKFASFFFSDAGESCAGMNEVLGGRLAAVTHLAPASRPPGLAVAFSHFRGQLCVMLAWVDDCLSVVEVAGLEGGLRAGLLGEGAS